MKTKSIIGLLLLTVALMSTSFASIEKGSYDRSPHSYVISSDQAVHAFVAVTAYHADIVAFETFATSGRSNLLAVGILADRPPVPRGTITYIKMNKGLYRSPFVDTHYIWEIQHWSNC